MTARAQAPSASPDRTYLVGLARAFGGALLFTVPLLMTMEMWQFGHAMDRGRLALFIALSLPLLYGLAHYAGFRHSAGFRENALDTLAALAVGFVLAAVLLSLFGLVDPGATLSETTGQVALQAVPGAVGALLARRQLAPAGDGDVDVDDEDASSYAAELFLMVAGALYIGFNVAPTEEIILIAFMMTPWHTLLLALVSIFLLHVIVYRVGFAGQETHESATRAFLHFTVPGYALVLLVSLYVLWTFGRTDGQSWQEIVAIAVVLAFPGAIGAAAARLLV